MRKFYIISISKKRLLSILVVLILIPVLIFSLSMMPSGFSIAEAVSSIVIRSADYNPGNSNPGGKLAIIIDDFGSSRKGVVEMMSIKRHMTFAVMPFLDFSEKDARAAHEKGYEVIVHLPMEANSGKLSWLGPRPIMTCTSNEDVKEIVKDSFKSVPYAVGANIHMGSKASSDAAIISSVLDVIKEKNLYFVDSRTANHPVSKKVANEKGILCYERDVFLDGQKPKAYVKKQLAEAGRIAVKKGNAVAIGHVGVEGGKVTADAITEMLPEFDSQNIQLVFVSELDK